MTCEKINPLWLLVLIMITMAVSVVWSIHGAVVNQNKLDAQCAALGGQRVKMRVDKRMAWECVQLKIINSDATQPALSSLEKINEG